MLRRQMRAFNTHTEIRFIEDKAKTRTILEVVTADRPALLARVGWSFADQKVRLQNAKISTFGERAEDVFFITDGNNQPLPNTRLEALRKTLTQDIDVA